MGDFFQNPVVFTVYKTMSRLDSRYYIGVHKTGDPNDDYLGSGAAIKGVIKKQGKQNFVKTVLFQFDRSIDAYNKEAEILLEARRDPLCYNISTGGWDTKAWTRRLYNDKEKFCPSCQAWLDLNKFGKSARHPSGRKSWCLRCFRKRNPAYVKKYRQVITDEEFSSLWEAQRRRCAVCHEPIPHGDRRASHVDHDPATRGVRGLLCSRCKAGVGCFQGNQIVIGELLRYLQAFERRRRGAGE